MDYGKILKRSWNILWSYRALWFFGILIALTTAGGGSNFNYSFGGNHNSNNNQAIYQQNNGDLKGLSSFMSAPF